ncbi:MAG: hypothetical protein LBM96_02920 [Methanobrevibacter sp.]|jgi:nonsense-mediated mRNA decay protein 3|nr:hypothetical protein [Candidatus Methanoflexus mossambicus]
MFCYECGAEEENLMDGLCKKCFLKTFSILTIPSEIVVKVCAHCNSKFVSGNWVDPFIAEEEIIYRVIEDNIVLNPIFDSPFDDNLIIDMKILQMRGTIAECFICARALVYDEDISEKHYFNVRLNKDVCPVCSKRNSGYYEAVIQLRADNRQLKDEEIAKVDEIIVKTLDKLFNKDKLAYIAQKATLKEGIDYYVGSLKSAKKLTNKIKEELGGLTNESPRLISEDKSTGKGLYRIWILIRLPSFCKGDFIRFNEKNENKIAQIINISGDKIISIDLNKYDTFKISWKNYNDIELIKEKNQIAKTTVISKSPSNIQILDPINYEAVDIAIDDKNPEKFHNYNIGDEIEVIEIDNILYIL